MTKVSERTKYKAQVYDVALSAFFKLRRLDAESLNESPNQVGWDIAEAMVAAAVSGVTYKSRNPTRLAEAAQLLRMLADEVERDGLAELEWGYKGKLDARHAWRPDIRSPEGLAELAIRVDAMIEAMMGPLRALTVPERRAIVCATFVKIGLEHISDLAQESPERAEVIHAIAKAALANAPWLSAEPSAEEASGNV